MWAEVFNESLTNLSGVTNYPKRYSDCCNWEKKFQKIDDQLEFVLVDGARIVSVKQLERFFDFLVCNLRAESPVEKSQLTH